MKNHFKNRLGSLSKRTANGDVSNLQRIARIIQGKATAAGSRWAPNKDIAGLTTSMESLDVAQTEQLADHEEGLVGDVADAIEEVGGEGATADYTQPQVDAAAATAMAYSQPDAYFQSRLDTGVAVEASTESRNFTVVQAPYGFDYEERSASLEAYDARTLTNFIGDSVVFNMQAARQLEFGESFYPTIVLTPDQTGFDLTIRRTMVLNARRHEVSGKFVDWNRRNVIDAYIDPTILADDSIKIVPHYIDGNAENNGFFAVGIAAREVEVNGITIKTAPLRPNVTIDLAGISQNPTVNAGGQLNQTDSIDIKANLQNLYFKITNQAGNTSDFIPFDVTGLQFTQFIRAPQGNARMISLNFVSHDLILTGTTKNIGDVASPALTYLATAPRTGWLVRLNVSVFANLDTETGELKLTSHEAAIDSVWDTNSDPTGLNGYTQITDGTELTALKNVINKIEVVGYDLIASRSNLNRRELGLLVNVFEEVVRYVVPLGAPITLQSPITKTRTNADLLAPVVLARARNENNAVTQLLRFRDQLKSIKPLLTYTNRKARPPRIEGIGHTVVYPFFDSVELKLDEVVQGIKSHERRADVSAAIVQQIRELVARMHTYSGYELAVEALDGQPTKPLLVIGVDPILRQHLIIDGDTRLAGIDFDHKVVSTMDMRVRGHIFLAFTRPNLGKADPLNFGNMAWIPELVTTANITREGGTSTETMVQPRSLHVNTCPILGEIIVTGLAAAVVDRIPTNMAIVA